MYLSTALLIYTLVAVVPGHHNIFDQDSWAIAARDAEVAYDYVYIRDALSMPESKSGAESEAEMKADNTLRKPLATQSLSQPHFYTLVTSFYLAANSSLSLPAILIEPNESLQKCLIRYRRGRRQRRTQSTERSTAAATTE